MLTVACVPRMMMEESVLSLKEKQQHNIGFPTFKLPASTNTIS